MNENDKSVIVKLTKLVDQILSGYGVTKINPEGLGTSETPEINELAEKLISLSEQYRDSYKFIINLSKGKLDAETPFRNSFANPYKQLHSELRYLTWQIQQIADGDYDQRVSFSGDFSEAINKMIAALRDRETLAELNKENVRLLKESNATKDKLFNIIAHDLKNPFNVLVGFSEVLLNEMQAGNYSEAEEYAGIINNSANQGYDLLVNLLDWSRLQSGRIEVSNEWLSLKEIIRHNIDVSIGALAKQLKIRYDDTQDYLIYSDKAILNTVLRNLLSNAIKYTQRNGEVEILVKKTPGFFQVSVKDSGIGITKKDIEKLFKIEIIHSTRGTDNEGGTGLGLILCKDFINKIGGDIWAESVYGQGTTFTFTIPDTELPED